MRIASAGALGFAFRGPENGPNSCLLAITPYPHAALTGPEATRRSFLQMRGPTGLLVFIRVDSRSFVVLPNDDFPLDWKKACPIFVDYTESPFWLKLSKCNIFDIFGSH